MKPSAEKWDPEHMTNWIAQYYAGIRTGEFVVGKWIRRWYEKLVTGIESGEFIFNPKKADAAIRFIESFCHHHEGALAPGLIKLETWEKALISVLCGIVNENGKRRFREAFVVMGRKNGKTLLAAALCCYFAVMDGEYGGEIYTAATRLEQAELAYNAFQQMITQEPEISDLAKKRRSDIYFPESNTTVRALSFSSRKSDGFNISFCVCDELAAWEGERGIRFYEVLRSSFAAREQPLLLAISTAGYVNEGIYDELMKRSTSVLNGASQEKGLAPFLYMIDEQTKWDDLTELEKANPNIGVTIPVSYLIEEIAIAKGSRSKKTEFMTKYCNVKQNSSAAWLEFATVERASGDELHLEDFRGSYCVGGVDLSQTRDLTACCVVIQKGEKLHVFARFFLPAEKIAEATARDGIPYQAYIDRGILLPSGEAYVDYHDCEAFFQKLVEEYEILPLKIGYDRYSAQYLIQDMSAYGFHVDDVYQGENLYGVIQETEGLLEDGKIDIGDNDLLKIHLLDSAIKMSTERGRGKLIKVRPSAHIDGCAALLDAMTVRQKWWGEIGEQLQNLG